jgi:heterodisulfide reductase subunit C
MDCSPVLSEWSALLEGGFDQARWDELAWSCMECSACAFVCPSCSCFDMNQQGTAWGGEQVRSWDGCTIELFTRHASGHNPRDTRGHRYRQRVLHKFAFRDEGQDDFRCVGCGRCITACPGGMNILDVVRGAVKAVEGGRDGAAG